MRICGGRFPLTAVLEEHLDMPDVVDAWAVCVEELAGSRRVVKYAESGR